VKIETKQFGTIEIDGDKVYTMTAGMPGFSDMKRFVVIEQEEIWPFHCYQCIDDSSLSFYIMNPYLFKKDYRVNLKQVAKEAGWSESGPENVKIYVIVNTASGIPEKITANMIGPLVINTHRLEAVQHVLHNASYSHKHPIFSPTAATANRQNTDTAVSI